MRRPLMTRVLPLATVTAVSASRASMTGFMRNCWGLLPWRVGTGVGAGVGEGAAGRAAGGADVFGEHLGALLEVEVAADLEDAGGDFDLPRGDVELGEQVEHRRLHRALAGDDDGVFLRERHHA